MGMARAAGDDRARRHLASIAGLGDTLRDVSDRESLGRAACEATRAALAADRAFVLFRDYARSSRISAWTVKTEIANSVFLARACFPPLACEILTSGGGVMRLAMVSAIGGFLLLGAALGLGCGDSESVVDATPIPDVHIDCFGPTMSPLSRDFGSVVVGERSGGSIFTVESGCGGTTPPLVAQVFGGDAADFAIAADSCSSVQLARGDSCAITVEFAPTAAGERASALRVNAGADSENVSTLTGEGATPAKISLSPTEQDFGEVAIGEISASFSFTITNDGGAHAGSVYVYVWDAPHQFDFQITSNDCAGVSLDVAESCTVTAVFAPDGVGTATAWLLAAPSLGDTVTAKLTGTGVASAGP